MSNSTALDQIIVLVLTETGDESGRWVLFGSPRAQAAAVAGYVFCDDPNWERINEGVISVTTIVKAIHTMALLLELKFYLNRNNE